MKKESRIGRVLLEILFCLLFLAIIYFVFMNSNFGKASSIILIVVFLVFAYIVVARLHFLDVLEKNKRSVVTAPQTTVEGILDEKTRSMLDKDGDGEIMISEYYPLTEDEVLKKVFAVDSKFSKEDFYAWVKHLYSTILEALDKENPVMLRRFESDYLYQRHIALFEDIKASGASISNYAIKGVLLKDFKIEGDKEILVVALSASINKVNIYDDNYKSYILTFARKKGVKTTGTLLEKETNCPNCGAVLDLDDHGVCSYCHTTVSNGDFGWILIDMKSIKLVGD